MYFRQGIEAGSVSVLNRQNQTLSVDPHLIYELQEHWSPSPPNSVTFYYHQFLKGGAHTVVYLLTIYYNYWFKTHPLYNVYKLYASLIKYIHFFHFVDHLNGVHVAQQRLFLLQGDLSMSFSWEDYGFVLNFKQHSLSSTSMCDIVVSALIGGHFQFPEDTELVSAVYAMSFSKDISQPVRIDIQHCVSLKNEQQSQQLVFAIAPLDGGLPFHFEIIKGGNFPLDSQYGSLNESDVTSFLIGILKLKNDGKVAIVNIQ